MRKGDIIKVFMERDGESLEEAKETYEMLKEDLKDAFELGDYDEAEAIMADYGLEMDYIC